MKYWPLYWFIANSNSISGVFHMHTSTQIQLTLCLYGWQKLALKQGAAAADWMPVTSGPFTLHLHFQGGLLSHSSEMAKQGKLYVTLLSQDPRKLEDKDMRYHLGWNKRLKEIKAHMNKLASLKTMLVQFKTTAHQPTEWLTEVKCRATSIAKKHAQSFP